MGFVALFKPNYDRFEGVRPINIYLLRLLFFLVAVFVGYDSWTTIIGHEGPWEPVKAAAWCMWAAFAVLSVLGLFHPLKMLPLVLFEILYKLVWLVIVAFPLWSTNQLAGSSAEGMTEAFLWVILPIIAVPWKYAVNKYIFGRTLQNGA